MERSIRDYVSEGADVSYEVLVSRFGEPEQVAFTYVNEMTTDEILENIKNGEKILKIALVTSLLVALMCGINIVVSYLDYERDSNGYAIVEIIEYERVEVEEGGE